MQKEHVFTALIPPIWLAEQMTEFKKEAQRMFGCKQALQSPPHITLLPPYNVTVSKWDRLLELHSGIAGTTKCFTQHVDGFDCFASRVIFIEPDLSSDLHDLHLRLKARAADEFPAAARDSRPFHPHITIAFKDLDKRTFRKAWPYFAKKTFNAFWEVTSLNLLKHNGEYWEVVREFPFSG